MTKSERIQKKVTDLLAKRTIVMKEHSKDPHYDDMMKAIELAIKFVFTMNPTIIPVDFIIETYTHLGDCPSILYDDNGLFAVVCDGAQPVVIGKEKISGTMTFFPEKKQWKKTIREAVMYYVKH